MDTLKLFKIFLRVADKGSFIRAAQSLDRPASTISAAVKELEMQLGTRLFHRTTRSVSLTIDGNAFYSRCLNAIHYIEETENLFRQSSSEVSGTIRVDVPSRVGNHIIINALPHFFRLYPAIKIELGVSDRNVNLAEDGIDCAIRVGHLENSGMVAKRIGELHIINVASKDYLSTKGCPDKPCHLSEHLMVGYASPTSGRKEAFEWVSKGELNRLVVTKTLTVNSAESSIAACVAGLGIIQIPAYDVSDLIENGVLCDLLSEYRPQPVPVNVLYPHRRHPSRPLRLFTDWLIPLLQRKMELKI